MKTIQRFTTACLDVVCIVVIWHFARIFWHLMK